MVEDAPGQLIVHVACSIAMPVVVQPSAQLHIFDSLWLACNAWLC
jgi:hypothetical protein